MKRYLVIDGDGHDLERAAGLLREQGFNVAQEIDSGGFREETEHRFPEGYRDIIESAPVGIFRSTLDGRFISVNPALARLLKYDSPEDLVETVNRRSIAEVLYLEPAKRSEVVEDLLSQEGWHVYELQYRCRDESIITCRDYIRKVPGARGVMELEGFVEDVTARKKVEEALQESEELFRIILENILDPVFITNDEGRFTFVCRNVPYILGYTVEDIQAMGNISKLFGRDLFALDALEKQGEIHNIDCVIHNKDGSWHDYLITVKRVSIKEGTILYLCRDITERKRTENELIDAHKQLERLLLFNEALLSAIPTPVFYKDRDGRYLGCNRAFTEVMGVTSEELKGKTVFELWPSEHAQEYHRKDLELMANPVRQIYDYKVRDKNGVVRPVIYAKDVFCDEEGQTAGIVGAFLDITERKRAEESLLRLNRELTAISKCHEVMIRAVDEQTLLNEICRIICDEAGYRMAWVGYAERDEAKSVRPVAWAGNEDGYLADARITWGDTERGRGPTGTAIRTGESVCIQDFRIDSHAFPWRANALQRGYLSSIALPLRDENAATFGVINIYSTEPETFTPNEMRLLGKLADDLAFGVITLRARAERDRKGRDLQNSNELLRAIIDAAPTAIIGLDLDGRVHTVWNRAAERMLGWSAEEVMGEFLPSVPLDKEEEFRRFRETIRSGKDLNGVEVRWMRRDGSPIDYSIYASPLHGADGRITGNIAVLVDICDKKRAENLIRENLTLLQTMVRNAPIILYGFDKNGVFTLSEGKGLAGMGLKPGEIVGRSLFDVYRDHPEAMGHLRRALAGEAFTAPLRFVDHVFDAYHEPVVGEDGAYAGTVGVVVDVTERAKAEEALKGSEEKYRAVADFTFDWETWLDPKGEFIYVSPSCERITCYSASEFLNDRALLKKIIHRDDRLAVKKHLRQVLRRDMDVQQIDFRIIAKDGQERWIEHICQPVFGSDGRWLGRRASNRDCTDRKRAEEKICTALAEKEVLLKEVHHRVKNNMQIISTLLDLQSEGIRDEESLRAFRESQDRIKAMALIHEMLYESSDMASIDFQRYIGDLSTHLFDSYLVDPARISLRFNTGGVSMNIDRAIPCGLIINELIANSLKHAFPDNRQGEIRIEFHRGEKGSITLMVADNGIGLPPGLDFTRTKTLGLQLVNMLARQLRGEIKVGNKGGASFVIRFQADGKV